MFILYIKANLCVCVYVRYRNTHCLTQFDMEALL